MDNFSAIYDLVDSVTMLDRMNVKVSKITKSFKSVSMEAYGFNKGIQAAVCNTEQVDMSLSKASTGVDGMNNKLKKSKTETKDLNSYFSDYVKSFATIDNVKKVLNLSDEMTQTTTKLNQMNDGLQSTGQLQDMIFQSANQSRMSYGAVADEVINIGKASGDAFQSTAEIVEFTEQMNKQFMLAGLSTENTSSAMQQLSQAMADGVISGDEFNSTLSQAPSIVQSMADYMGLPEEQLSSMADKGQITADTLKSAMFAASEETNAKFTEMPMTFSQIWTTIQNDLLQTFQPILELIAQGAQWIADNWSNMEPIFFGAAAAVGAFAVGLGIMKIATIATEIASKGLNATLKANPLMLIASIIGIVIAVIYKWVQSVGGLKIAWMIVVDKLLFAWDLLKFGFFTGVFWVMDLISNLQIAFYTMSTNIQNFLGDMKVNVLMILQSMVNGAIDLINKFTNTINSVLGTSIETIATVTFGTEAQLANEAAKKARNEDLDNYIADKEAGKSDRDEKLNQMVEDALTATADRQANIIAEQTKADELADNASDGTSIPDTPYDDDAFPNIPIEDTDPLTIEGTGANGAVEVDMADEDIGYLRDIAERDYISKVANNSLAPNISLSFGDVHETADANQVAGRIREILQEEIATASEGVYAHA